MNNVYYKFFEPRTPSRKISRVGLLYQNVNRAEGKTSKLLTQLVERYLFQGKDSS